MLINIDMPVKMYHSLICNKRFDFGVPLEDIFPHHDIHPRLKYIFDEAYCQFIMSQTDLEVILRPHSASLSDCMKLRDILTYDTHYHKSDFTPHAYFRLVKRFLDMLPIPLLPDYSQYFEFDWQFLSAECRDFFNGYEKGKKNYRLENSIAKHLKYLPHEHFLLLNSLIMFLRKVSQKSDRSLKMRQKSLYCVTKFYSSSICSGLYRLECKIKEDAMFPLLFYLILRWRYLKQLYNKLKDPDYHPDSFYSNYISVDSIDVDCYSHRPLIKPTDDVNYIRLAIPEKKKIYLKDFHCQTETVKVADKGIQSEESSVANQLITDNSIHALLEPIANSTVRVDDDVQLNEKNNHDTKMQHDYTFLTAAGSTPDEVDAARKTFGSEEGSNSELPFFSFAQSEKQEDWLNIMAETNKTIKKVDGYIYDDYETFQSEDFNQIGTKLKSPEKSGTYLLDRISKIGWTYTPPKNSARELTKSQSLIENSYIKFDDVDSRSAMGETEQSNWKSLSVMFKQNEKLDKEVSMLSNRSTTFFNLKKFKINFDFLRIFRKDERPRLIFENNTNVKYIRMRNFNTL